MLNEEEGLTDEGAFEITDAESVRLDRVVSPKNKPRVRFCWACGNKLWGNHHTIVTGADGHDRVLHKKCEDEAKEMLTA